MAIQGGPDIFVALESTKPGAQIFFSRLEAGTTDLPTKGSDPRPGCGGGGLGVSDRSENLEAGPSAQIQTQHRKDGAAQTCSRNMSPSRKKSDRHDSNFLRQARVALICA